MQNIKSPKLDSPMILDDFQVLDLAEGLDFEAKKAAGKDGQGQLPDSFFSTYSAMANTEHFVKPL